MNDLWLNIRSRLLLGFIFWGALWAIAWQVPYSLAGSSNYCIAVFRASDTHTHLKHMINYIRTIAYRTRELKKQCEGELVTLVINDGDSTGVSRYTFRFDNGYRVLGEELMFDAYTAMAHEHHVIIVRGNHDGFDWAGTQYETGEQNSYDGEIFRRFYQDMARQGAKGRSEGLLAANVIPTAQYADLYRPYHDVPLPDGTKLRVIGLALKNLVHDSGYNENSRDQHFDFDRMGTSDAYLQDVADSLKRQLRFAARDGIKKVIIEIHDKRDQVQKAIEEVLAWKARYQWSSANPSGSKRLAAIQILYSGWGHDHKKGLYFLDDPSHSSDGGYIPSGKHALIGSGAQFEMTELFFDFGGRFKNNGIRPWSIQDQGALEIRDQDLPVHTRGILRPLRNHVQRVDEVMQEPLAMLPHPIPDGDKIVIKETDGRSPYPTTFATAMRNWGFDQLETVGFYPEHPTKTARQVLQDELKIEIRGVLAFQNSNSIRIETEGNLGIPAGPYTKGHSFDSQPFNEPLRYFVRTGAEIMEIFQGVRAYMRDPANKGIYSPQVDEYIRINNWKFEIQDPDTGAWSPLVPNAHYLLITDRFTGQKLMRTGNLKSLAEHYDTQSPLLTVSDNMGARDMHETYQLPLLVDYAECAAKLGSLGR